MIVYSIIAALPTFETPLIFEIFNPLLLPAIKENIIFN